MLSNNKENLITLGRLSARGFPPSRRDFAAIEKRTRVRVRFGPPIVSLDFRSSRFRESSDAEGKKPTDGPRANVQRSRDAFANVRTRKSRCAEPAREKLGGPLLRFVDDEAGGHNFKPLDLLDDDDSREDADGGGDETGRNRDASSTTFPRDSGVPFAAESRVKRTTATAARARRTRSENTT